VQKALEEGRLKFGDKSRQSIHVDANPLKTIDTLYVDVAYINMVEVSEEIIVETLSNLRGLLKVIKFIL
jgi:hypothetical protein